MIYILFFILYSFLGWILDTIYSTIAAKKAVYGGMFKSYNLPIPLAPIYGFGALILIILFDFLLKQPFILMVIIISVVLTAAEYVGGVFCLNVLGRRAWDYRNSYLNLHGHIDLWHSIFWTILGTIFIMFFHSKVLESIDVIKNYLISF